MKFDVLVLFSTSCVTFYNYPAKLNGWFCADFSLELTTFYLRFDIQ